MILSQTNKYLIFSQLQRYVSAHHVGCHHMISQLPYFLSTIPSPFPSRPPSPSPSRTPYPSPSRTPSPPPSRTSSPSPSHTPGLFGFIEHVLGCIPETCKCWDATYGRGHVRTQGAVFVLNQGGYNFSLEERGRGRERRAGREE